MSSNAMSPETVMDSSERPAMIRRFSGLRVAEHWSHVLLFAALAMTGLSQKYYSLEPSQWFIISVGGIDAVRIIHRWAAVAFSALLSLHVIATFMGIAFLKWQPSMLVTRRDIENAIHNIKYYCGLLQSRARCGKYDYKQKFIYWLVITSALMMASTGLALWAPTKAAALLGGQAIPAAKAVHSNHAMLILLLISVWHIYDSVFSPDVFPLDKSMFSGYISRDRMLEEHPLELARLEGCDPDELKGQDSGGGSREPAEGAPR